MKTNMFKRSIQVFLIAITPLILAGCLNGYGGCAPDSEKNEARFYVVNLNGDLSAVERNWSENGHGALVIYGLDESQNYLYYSDNYIYSPEEIIRLNYETGSESTIILDEEGERFSLSPDGNLFVYEKNPTTRTSDISIVSLTDTVSILVPRDSTVKSNRFPKWISNNEITYNAFGETDGLGIFKANIVDSTIEQLTELNGRWGYDVSDDAEIIVFSAETEGNDGLSESSIFLKNTFENDPIYIGPGTYPLLIPTKEKFIYEDSDGIMLSDFNGNTELLYSGDYSHSIYRSASVSPDGSSIVIANYEGLFLIDIETRKITQLTEKSDFMIGNGHWESINSSFNSPWFSADGSKIYFSITLNYFDDGC